MARTIQNLRRVSAAALAAVFMTCSCASAADFSHYLTDARYDRLYRLYRMFFNDGDKTAPNEQVSSEEQTPDVSAVQAVQPEEETAVSAETSGDVQSGKKMLEEDETVRQTGDQQKDIALETSDTSPSNKAQDGISTDGKISEALPPRMADEPQISAGQPAVQADIAPERLEPSEASSDIDVPAAISKSDGLAKLYRVIKGDCLWRISKKEYGFGSRWQAIYRANESTIQDPDLIYIDQLLNIPTESSLYER